MKAAQRDARQEEAFKLINDYLCSQRNYRNPKLTSKKLSEAIGFSGRIIASTLNERVGMGFCKYLNHLRLTEVCRRLASPKFSQYTAEEIGLSVGYISRQHFYLVFTREMGCTPGEYRENHLVHAEVESDEL